MTIVAVDPVANVDFVPKSEKKKKEPTAFIVRPLKESEKMPVLEEMLESDFEKATTSGGSKVRISSTKLADLFRKTLSGWKNFNDSSGNPVMFNSRNKDVNIDRIPFETAVEGGSYVFFISKFTEEEAKNSDGQ